MYPEQTDKQCNDGRNSDLAQRAACQLCIEKQLCNKQSLARQWEVAGLDAFARHREKKTTQKRSSITEMNHLLSEGLVFTNCEH